MNKIEAIRNLVLKSWQDQDFNHLGFAYIDFNESEIQFLEIHDGHEYTIPNFYFDLASLTKVLTVGTLALSKPEWFTGDKKLLLEHRGGLPRWAILGRSDWRQTVYKFPIRTSPEVYSDLSILRLMLILEEEYQVDLHQICKTFWDKELLFWKDLPRDSICPNTGFRQGKVINGEVNDDNCFKINRFCTHAGLFSTLSGLCRTLIKIESELGLCQFHKKIFDSENGRRFHFGWDTVESPDDTLAGIGAPLTTFGHLGFTGTSIWIDSETKKGWVLLTNNTVKYWFHRSALTKLRKELGQFIW